MNSEYKITQTFFQKNIAVRAGAFEFTICCTLHKAYFRKHFAQTCVVHSQVSLYVWPPPSIQSAFCAIRQYIPKNEYIQKNIAVRAAFPSSLRVSARSSVHLGDFCLRRHLGRIHRYHAMWGSPHRFGLRFAQYAIISLNMKLFVNRLRRLRITVCHRISKTVTTRYTTHNFYFFLSIHSRSIHTYPIMPHPSHMSVCALRNNV